MKLLASLMLVLISSQCFANSYVRVTGIGFSNLQAREDAFKQAIQIKSKSVLLSEQELKNGTISHNISLYSSGYIEDFNIIDQTQKGNKFYITMDVIVSESKIAERLHTGSNVKNEFNGSLHYEQSKSIKIKDESRIPILTTILKDYPNNSYVISSLPYDVYYSSDNVQIDFPITLSWKHEWLNSLNELITIISDKKGSLTKKGNYNVVFIGSSNDIVLGSLLARNRNHYIFYDQDVYNHIKFYIANNDARIKITLLDNYGRMIHSQCHFINSSFYNFKEYKHVIFFTNHIYKTKLSISIPHNMLKNIKNYDIKIVANKDC